MSNIFRGFRTPPNVHTDLPAFVDRLKHAYDSALAGPIGRALLPTENTAIVPFSPEKILEDLNNIVATRKNLFFTCDVPLGLNTTQGNTLVTSVDCFYLNLPSVNEGDSSSYANAWSLPDVPCTWFRAGSYDPPGEASRISG